MTLPSMRTARWTAASVPAAFLLANALSYALLLVAAHRISAAAYGELSSLLGLLLVATIPALALQTVAARRVAVHGTDEGVRAGTVRFGLGATVVLALVSPALAAFLHLHGVLGVLLVAATVPPLALIGAASGVAQGRREFRRLGLLILGGTGGRALGGLVAIVAFGTPDAALAGILVGAIAAATCTALDVARHSAPQASGTGAPGLVLEAAHATHAHGLFLLLTSLDVLLARHVLTSSQAGVYAVGAVLTRAALWLPQSLVLLLFASLAQQASRRAAGQRAALITTALGAVAVAGTALLGPLVVSAVGGSRYHRLDSVVWLWALLGALLAVVQLAVLAGLARRSRRRAVLLWAMLVADVAVVLGIGAVNTPQRLVVGLICVAAVGAGVSLWLVLREPHAMFAPDAPGHAGGPADRTALESR
ncbi:hypothetical protein [uncultured Jatrophihabitans sp.]|uniref:hypothetical protein n=1 Tax=uncultured Jatrophihabitans sp. TaxID=1610747 RepID=UPI0035CB776F